MFKPKDQTGITVSKAFDKLSKQKDQASGIRCDLQCVRPPGWNC